VLKLGRAEKKDLSGQDVCTTTKMDITMKHLTPHVSISSSLQMRGKSRGKSERSHDVFGSGRKSSAAGELEKRAQKPRSFSNNEVTLGSDVQRELYQQKKPKGEPEVVGEVGKEKFGEVEDFECKLCYSLLFQPITTICGHTFCRECLERCLDHRVECPCCRTVLDHHNRRDLNMEITEVLDFILAKYFTADYNERRKTYREKMDTLMR